VSTAHSPLFLSDIVGDQPVEPPLPNNGVAVIDASDPHHPRLRTILHGIAEYDGWEALEANEERGVLVVSGTGRHMNVYDVSGDCGNPRLRSTMILPTFSHGLRLSADGRTAWGGFLQLYAIALDDLDHPRTLLVSNMAIHDLDLSDDGRRAYVATGDVPSILSTDLAPMEAVGLRILDITEVTDRRPNPQVHQLGTVSWAGYSHTARLIHIPGPGGATIPYIVSSDEVGSFREGNLTDGLPVPTGAGRLINIADERHPRIVSTLALAVNDRVNAAAVAADLATYTSHYNGVDDPNHTTTVFYSWYNSGLRAFDVRDPEHPKEFAYYNPPARPLTTYRSILFRGGLTVTNDSTTSEVRYRPETGEIWVVSASNGFQILRLTDAARANGLAAPTRPVGPPPATPEPSTLQPIQSILPTGPAGSVAAYCSLLRPPGW
jgi:hypothetical protein